jgi:hypothetical protein
MAGSRAVDAREPGQIREEAALSESVHAPRIGLAGAEDRRERPEARFDGGCTVHCRELRSEQDGVFAEWQSPRPPKVKPPKVKPRLLLLAIALLAAIGCGEKQVKTGKVEALIEDGSANKELIESVDCPGDVEANKGDTFDCAIEIKDGSKEKVTVRQLDDDGSVRVVGNRQTQLGRDKDVKIRPENAERLIQSNSEKPLDSIRCPEGVRLERGATFDCHVLGADGSRGVVTIVQVDDLGNIRIAKVRRQR